MAVLFAAFCALMPAARREIAEGNAMSPVKVLIFEDLQCSDCTTFRTLLDEKLLPKYGQRVAFIHRDFPLGKHDWARPAAIAARWVSQQNADLGIAIRRELLAEQNTITATSLKPWLIEFAVRNRLNSNAIIGALNDPAIAALVDQDLASGMARGIKHTPTVLVEGQTFVETIVYEDVARALDEALK
jgi:protein-disulfide isomerase